VYVRAGEGGDMRLNKSDKRTLAWAVYWASINRPTFGQAPLKCEGCPYTDDYEIAIAAAEQALRKMGCHWDKKGPLSRP